jgi:hypothetical protein
MRGQRGAEPSQRGGALGHPQVGPRSSRGDDPDPAPPTRHRGARTTDDARGASGARRHPGHVGRQDHRRPGARARCRRARAARPRDRVPEAPRRRRDPPEPQVARHAVARTAARPHRADAVTARGSPLAPVRAVRAARSAHAAVHRRAHGRLPVARGATRGRGRQLGRTRHPQCLPERPHGVERAAARRLCRPPLHGHGPRPRPGTGGAPDPARARGGYLTETVGPGSSPETTR